MPEAWGDKRERQYEHIKQSELEQGKPEGKAEQIAARTVNKQRRQAGETPNQRTQGTGNPRTRFENRTRDELANRANEMRIPGAGVMGKDQLIAAIRAKR